MKKGIIVALLVAFCLAGCGENEIETTQEANGVIMTRGRGFTEDGLTYVKDSITHFVDFSTGEDMPLCSRLGCPHRVLTAEELENGTEPCMAYVEYAYQALLYQERLYIFAENHKEGISVYVSDVDGANRKCLVEIPECSWTNGFSTQFCGENIVLLAKRTEFVEGENGEREAKSYTSVYTIDCESGEFVKSAKEWEEQVEFVGIDETYAYVKLEYIDDAVFETRTQEEVYADSELVRDYTREELWECALADGTVRELGEGAFDGRNHITTGGQNGAFVTAFLEEQQTERYYLEFATGERKEVDLPSGREVYTNREGVLYLVTTEDEEGVKEKLYRLHPGDGTYEALSYDESLRVQRVLAGNVYCRDGEQMLVIPLADFLAGKNEPIYELKGTIYDIIK